MPRFYFDFLDGSIFDRDDEGCECRDLLHARNEALATLGATARDELRDGCEGAERAFQISVRDTAGAVLLNADLMVRVLQRI